jgi:hypothetical protein
VTNSEQENDSSKKKEIYMTSVGRISIASDGEYTASSRQLTSDRFMEESHKEVGKHTSVIPCLISETIFVTLAPISVLINSATSPLKSISC